MQHRFKKPDDTGDFFVRHLVHELGYPRPQPTDPFSFLEAEQFMGLDIQAIGQPEQQIYCEVFSPQLDSTEIFGARCCPICQRFLRKPTASP